jgi:hypothetical protein
MSDADVHGRIFPDAYAGRRPHIRFEVFPVNWARSPETSSPASPSSCR